MATPAIAIPHHHHNNHHHHQQQHPLPSTKTIPTTTSTTTASTTTTSTTNHHVPDTSVTSPKGLDVTISQMDKSSQPDSTTQICDKCQTSKKSGVLTCTCCVKEQSRKRKYQGKCRVSEDIKRRSIPSPSESSPALSPKSSDDFESVMNPESVDPMTDEHAVFVGSTTELESSLFSILDMSHLTGQSTSFVERGSSLFSLDHDLAVRSRASRLHATRKIISAVGSLGPSLINAYENNIHLNFPVVADDFLDDARQGIIERLEPTLLAAIYAVAVPWLETREPPSASSLDSIAFGLFTSMLSAPSIHIIQAGLLLMQRPDVDSKTLNSQLVGAAYEIGLHLDCSSWTSIPEEKKCLRRRLAWALYMQDTWCSLIHGRPSWIDQNNWAVRDLRDEDMEAAPDSEVANGHKLFQQLVSLTKILSSILDTFYTLKAMRQVEERGQTGTRLVLERAKPVQLRLKNWFSELPPILKMDTIEVSKPTAIGLLHLAYFATEITLHRCIIRSLETSNTDTYLAHICRSAAKTRLISAMDFVNRLRPEHLRAFWYFPAPVSFALIASFGSLLLATAPCSEEQEFYQTRLSEYRWTVGVSSLSAPLLSLAIETLDQGEKLLKNLPSKPPNSEISMAMPAPVQAPSSFDDASRMEYSESDSGETLELDGQHQHSTSGLMSPSTSTEDGYLDSRMS